MDTVEQEIRVENPLLDFDKVSYVLHIRVGILHLRMSPAFCNHRETTTF